jgi:putative FmdB family regulatory protein
MPQYDFACSKCRKKFTLILTMSEYDKQKSALKCPKCGSKKVERRWASFFAVTSKKS